LASPEPGEGSLDDPPFEQDDEALGLIGALGDVEVHALEDGLQRPGTPLVWVYAGRDAAAGEGGAEPIGVVSLVGETPFGLWASVAPSAPRLRGISSGLRLKARRRAPVAIADRGATHLQKRPVNRNRFISIRSSLDGPHDAA
jgi:hypothetical protein